MKLPLDKPFQAPPWWNQFYWKPSRSEMVFITIAITKKDRSTTALIKKIPLKIKTYKLVPKNKWQEITTPKIRTYNFLSSSGNVDLNYEWMLSLHLVREIERTTSLYIRTLQQKELLTAVLYCSFNRIWNKKSISFFYLIFWNFRPEKP